jgi:Bacterial Ig-like domain (group 3)
MTSACTTGSSKRYPSWAIGCVCRRRWWLASALVVVLAGAAAPAASAFIYWDNGGAGIGRANLDGSGADSSFIISARDASGVAVDGSHVYWAWNSLGPTPTGGIGRANLDGSEADQNFITGLGETRSLVVDATHIYWASAGNAANTIGRANLDGTGVNDSFITGAEAPCGVAVDGAHIYWRHSHFDNGSQLVTIGRANLDGSSVNPSFISTQTLWNSQACGMAVDSSHLYWPWTSNTGGAISRANLDGSGFSESFISPLDTPCGVTVDATHIYWEDPRADTIGRAKLDGTGVNPTFIQTFPGCDGVAVDSLLPAATVLSSTPGSFVFGQLATFTATVTGSATTPTGTVRFKINGATVGSPVALNAGGQASFSPSGLLDVGDTVTAGYSGNATYGASSGDLQPDLQPADTATSLSTSGNPQAVGADVTFIATVGNSDTDITPFGSVQFLIDGEPVLDPQPLDDNGQAGIIVSFDAGDYVVTAAYEDDTAAIPDFTGSQDSLTEHITGPPAPPPPATPSGGRDTRAAVISSALVAPARWRLGSLLPRFSLAPEGTTIRFRLDEDATVTLTFAKAAAGRHVGRRCVRPTRTNRARPRCTRYVNKGSLRRAMKAGLRQVHFQGRINRARRLGLGRHRVTIGAVDAAGNRSTTRSAFFTIVRR